MRGMPDFLEGDERVEIAAQAAFDGHVSESSVSSRWYDKRVPRDLWRGWMRRGIEGLEAAGYEIKKRTA